MWAAARDSWKSLRAFPLSSRLAPHFPLLFFKLPVIFFSEGSGVWAGKGREAAMNGRGSGRKRGTFCDGMGCFCDGMGQKIPRGAGKQAGDAALGKGVRQKKSPRGGEAGRRGGFGEGSSAKKIPRGAGMWDGGAALWKGVRQKKSPRGGEAGRRGGFVEGSSAKKSPRGGDVELFGGVVYNLYPREMSPARFLAPSSENLSTPKSASMPRVNPEGNWYPTMACMPASKRFTPLRLKVFSS